MAAAGINRNRAGLSYPGALNPTAEQFGCSALSRQKKRGWKWSNVPGSGCIYHINPTTYKLLIFYHKFFLIVNLCLFDPLRRISYVYYSENVC